MARRRRGANALEFALLAPAFVFSVVGIMDYSWMVYQLQGIQGAVQVGCRGAATIDPGLNEQAIGALVTAAEEKILAAYTPVVGGLCADCEVTVSAVGTLPNRSLQCSLVVPHTALTGLAPTPAALGATTVRRLEYQRRQQ